MPRLNNGTTYVTMTEAADTLEMSYILFQKLRDERNLQSVTLPKEEGVHERTLYITQADVDTIAAEMQAQKA